MRNPPNPLSKPLKWLGLGVIVTTTLALVACQNTANKVSTEQAVSPVSHKELTNYGEPNLKQLSKRLHDPSAQVHIVQIGDSHTAADFFSGTLRAKFQARYGDAGIGFVPPTTISGQRTANIKFTEPKKEWSLLSSRKTDAPNFPLGGFMMSPTTDHSSLTMQARNTSVNDYTLKVLYQSSDPATLTFNAGTSGTLNLTPSTDWRFSDSVPVTFPTEMTANAQGNLSIGGWLIAGKQPGVMLSSLGINGSTIAMTSKWQAQWVDTLAQLQPDMVILAYGTNEAFDEKLDLNQYQAQLTQVVKNIRQRIPHAVILMVGPSDSIKHKKALDCASQQPANLHNVMHIQQAVAQSEHLLYWNWQQFMGGDCSIDSWIAQDLARPDKVHFTLAGYQKSATALYEALEGVLK